MLDNKYEDWLDKERDQYANLTYTDVIEDLSKLIIKVNDEIDFENKNNFRIDDRLIRLRDLLDQVNTTIGGVH